MKNFTAALLSLVLIFTFSVTGVYAISAETAAEDIINYLLTSTNSASAQAFADGYLSLYAGMGAEWYAYSLSRCENLDFSVYTDALEKYNDSGAGINVVQAEKHALILMSLGAGNSYASEILDDSAFGLGIMSRIFALHIINNGFSTEKVNADTVISSILSLKKADGGWAVSDGAADVDCTAMVLQAVAPYYAHRDDVKLAADGALALLSSRQQSNGGFMSYGNENCESCVQVILALTSIGIDPDTDARFIKNGHVLTEVLSSYRLPDGSYSHLPAGAYNGTSTVQALEAYVSLKLLAQGRRFFDPAVTAQPAVTSEESFSDRATSAAAQSQAPLTALTNQVETVTVTETLTTVDTPSGENDTMPQLSVTCTQPAEARAESKKFLVPLLCAAAVLLAAVIFFIISGKHKR